MSSNLQQQAAEDNNKVESPITDCSDQNIDPQKSIDADNKGEQIQSNHTKDEALKAGSIIEEQNNQQQQTQDQQNQTSQENHQMDVESTNPIPPNQPDQEKKNDPIEVEKDNSELIKFSDNEDNKIHEEGDRQQIMEQKPKQQQQQLFHPPKKTQEQQQEEDRIFFQTLTYQQKQKLQEIQYYVYQDLANVLGILTDTTETIKHFQNVKDQTYVPIAINKLVLQTNISNAIHFDCGFNYKDQGLKELYISEKQHASQIFDEFYQQFDIQNNEKIKECVDLFKYNLSKNPEMKQATQLPVNVDLKAGFNQSVVQKIFDGMNQVSQTMDKIKEGEYKKLQKEDFVQLIQQRRERAQLLLKQNFPQDCQNQPQSQNNKVHYH